MALLLARQKQTAPLPNLRPAFRFPGEPKTTTTYEIAGLGRGHAGPSRKRH